jgi:hypothetical protein
MAFKADFKDPTRYMSLGMVGTNDLWGSGQQVDSSFLDTEKRVRELMGQAPAFQSAYSADWLKNRQGQIQLGQQNLLDENAGQAAAQQRSAWDQMAMQGGVGQGGDASRMAYNASRDQAMGRQGVLNQGAQQNLDANLEDYNLKAQDVAQRNTYEQNKWQAMMDAEAGLGLGRQQAMKKTGGAFGGGGLFGTGMFA